MFWTQKKTLNNNVQNKNNNNKKNWYRSNFCKVQKHSLKQRQEFKHFSLYGSYIFVVTDCPMFKSKFFADLIIVSESKSLMLNLLAVLFSFFSPLFSQSIFLLSVSPGDSKISFEAMQAH